VLPAQTFKTLYTFTGGADGESPGVLFSFDYTDGRGMFDSGFDYGGIVQATDGYLYGAAPGGGANTGCDFGSGCGTIYQSTRRAP
jgi:hypothetical protein